MTITGTGAQGGAVTAIQTGAAPRSGMHRVFEDHSLDPVVLSGMLIRNGYDVEASTGGCGAQSYSR
jgi:hypothetical protein